MSLLIYGATGYTGRLIAARAREAGLAPILAGRDPVAVRELADGYGWPARIAALDDPAALDALLRGVRVVLHCAGPFASTSRPMVDACLRAGADYLDITGEWEVFEACAARGAEAEARGVLLLPGVGFDVVPSDCLAAHLARRLPSATSLALGFESTGGVSRGTALTMVRNLGRPGVVRRGGRVVEVPPAFDVRTIDFGAGPRVAATIPWGDVSTAWHSTGIGDVRVYTALPPRQLALLRRSRWLGWLLRSGPVQRRLERRVHERAARRGAGPDEAARDRGRTFLWGEVRDAAGRTRISRLAGPDGYTLTAHAAVHIAGRVLAGERTAGFRTPSRAFGPELVLGLHGVADTFADE